MWRRGETDLVVHNDVHCSTGLDGPQAGQRKAFRNDALTCKCRITVQKDRHDCRALIA